MKTTLVTAAWSAVRTKDSYLRAQFLRIKSRRGAKHSDRHDTGKTIGRLVRRLQDLGCEVDIKRAA